MGIKIDWDNYEIIEAEDFSEVELDNSIEDTREVMDYLAERSSSIPEKLEELLVELGQLKGEE